MGYYIAQKSAIETLLESVSGIGEVYTSPQNVTNETNFKTRFVKNGVVNTCWLSRQSGTDDEHAKFGSVDERDIITHTQIDDYWLITLLYGYDESKPSETDFQNLVDAIQDTFRFIQNLGGDMYEISHPLQRIACGVFQFLNGLVLCHKAEFKLIVTERIVDESEFTFPSGFESSALRLNIADSYFTEQVEIPAANDENNPKEFKTGIAPILLTAKLEAWPTFSFSTHIIRIVPIIPDRQTAPIYVDTVKIEDGALKWGSGHTNYGNPAKDGKYWVIFQIIRVAK